TSLTVTFQYPSAASCTVLRCTLIGPEITVGAVISALVKVSPLRSAIRESLAQASITAVIPAEPWAASREHAVVRPGATVSRVVSGAGAAVSEPSCRLSRVVPLGAPDR